MRAELTVLVEKLAVRAVPEEGTGRLRLPTERELVASLDISRGALREQLSVLEMLGFIDRTQGRGSYLQVPDAGFLQLWVDLSRRLAQLSASEVAGAREMLEVSVAEAAAPRATPVDVAELRALVDRMCEAAATGNDEDAFEADLEFHRRLTRIVDNPVFTVLGDGLARAVHDEVAERRRRAVARLPLDHGGRRVIDTVHYGIVDALAVRDADRARAAMRHHFEVWSEVVGSS